MLVAYEPKAPLATKVMLLLFIRQPNQRQTGGAVSRSAEDSVFGVGIGCCGMRVQVALLHSSRLPADLTPCDRHVPRNRQISYDAKWPDPGWENLVIIIARTGP